MMAKLLIPLLIFLTSLKAEEWKFVSIPDFLNFDIEYPQKGWEDSLSYILTSMKNENPEFAVVPGDLVMGHWGTTEKEINSWADKYYPPWLQRFKDKNLKVYAAIGDHEIGDNPWKGARADAVPFYKEVFKKHLKMPLNGPEHMLGTAFYWTCKNALFISVDVFEKGQGKEGSIVADVSGKQLIWLRNVLSKYRKEVKHIIVMGHTPVLRPVRTFSSSGMLLEKGSESNFWKTLVEFNVDLYLCGEVHAVTCTVNQGVQQVAHGGLLGRTEKPNYLLVTLMDEKISLEIKEIDLINGKGRLWQYQKSKGPWDTVSISEESKKRGFQSIGSVLIDKTGDTKKFLKAEGFFNKPLEKEK